MTCCYQPYKLNYYIKLQNMLTRSTNNAPVTMLLRFCRLILDESIQILDVLNVESDCKDCGPFRKQLFFSLLPSLTHLFCFKRTLTAGFFISSICTPIEIYRQNFAYETRKGGIAERNYRDYERSSKCLQI